MEEEIRIDGNDEEKENILETAKNFGELYGFIKKFGQIIGQIIGSDGEKYEPDYLIKTIESVREGMRNFQRREKITGLTGKEIRNKMKVDFQLHALLRQITRSEGLRGQVIDLLIDEAIKQETDNKNNEDTKQI